jgi:hypothetical protein
MSVREIINQNSKITIVVIAVCAVGALTLAAYQGHTSGVIVPTRGYFSDDDGKTYFQDDASKIAPFDHDGKQAVTAYVFTGSDGKPFIGYLERAISPQAKDIVTTARQQMVEQAATQTRPDMSIMEQIAKNVEVKRPGADKWVHAVSPQARSVVIVTDAAGNPATAVAP